MTVNGISVRRGAQSSGVLFTVYFCPEDLFLIRDGAAARRKLMDTALCQLRPKYAQALMRYNKAYESKTRILRDSEERPDLLAALPEFNHQMALAGATVIHYRAQFAARLAEYAEASHRECSGGRETLTLRYETVKTVTDPFADLSTLFMQLSEHQREHRVCRARGPAVPVRAAQRRSCGAHRWRQRKILFFPGADPDGCAVHQAG